VAGPAGVLARPRMRAQPGARPESARQRGAVDGTSRALGSAKFLAIQPLVRTSVPGWCQCYGKR